MHESGHVSDDDRELQLKTNVNINMWYSIMI